MQLNDDPRKIGAGGALLRRSPERLFPAPRTRPAAVLPARSRDPRRAGFTILEIMIATAILTLGLVGILALFPVAIKTGKQIVDTTTAAVIAESVADAIRQGMRNSTRFVPRNNTSHAYFLFKHDGVKDEIPAKREAESADSDYYILLPRFRLGAAYTSRQQAVTQAPVFLYPETDSLKNGGGDAYRADDDGDDRIVGTSGGKIYKDVRVERTYQLGQFLPGLEASNDLRVLADQQIESLKQYSFAFTIQGSYKDVNLHPDETRFVPGNRLYRVKVMVFRGFLPPGPDTAPPDPVFELHFEVSL